MSKHTLRMIFPSLFLLIASCNPKTMADEPPPHLAKAFKILNEGRKKEGLDPFKWSNKLHQSAQELADWGWKNYIAKTVDVSADPHWEFLERLDRAGWKYAGPDGRLLPKPPPGRPGGMNASEYGIGGSSESKGEDGKNYPKDPSGWCHPYKTAESHAREAVWFLTSGAIPDPNEGHVWDFHAKFTHAAIGYNKGIFIIDYGYLP